MDKVKKIFGILCLTAFMGFAVYNLISVSDSLALLAGKINNINSVEDAGKWLDDVASEAQDELCFRNKVGEIYSGINTILGRKAVKNLSVVKEKDMIYYGSTYNEPLESVNYYTEQIMKLDRMVSELGMKLIVVVPPTKILYGVNDVSSELPINNPNAKMDKLMSQMQQRHIRTVDMRIPLQKTGLEIGDLFFATDHYWTPLGAFIGTSYLLDYMEKDSGIAIEDKDYYMNPENYDVKVYEDAVIGNLGYSVGRNYSGMDDYEIWTINNYSDIDAALSVGEITKTGNIRECLIDETFLNDGSPYMTGIYNPYIGVINEHESLDNNSNPDGMKLAVLRDSYFSPMAYYMLPMCSEIDLFWNYNSAGKRMFFEAIDNKKYDYVIFEIQPYYWNENHMTLFGE